MAQIKVAHFKWNDGKPRWTPSPSLRKEDWKSRALKNAQGEYLSFPEAVHEAQKINQEVANWRKGRSKLPLEKKSQTQKRTCQALYHAWSESHHFQKNKPKTQKDYRLKMKVFLQEFGQVPVLAIKKHHLYGFWEQMRKERGANMANGTIAVARACFSHAERIGWMEANPARKIGMTGTKPRQVVWKPHQILTLIDAAMELEQPSVAFASIIAIHSGQRQGDVLSMLKAEMLDNKIRITQNKRGAFIDVPQTPQMLQCINDIKQQHIDLNISDSETLIINKNTLKPFKADNFGANFRKVRKHAALKDPSILGLKYSDFSV